MTSPEVMERAARRFLDINKQLTNNPNQPFIDEANRSQTTGIFPIPCNPAHFTEIFGDTTEDIIQDLHQDLEVFLKTMEGSCRTIIDNPPAFIPPQITLTPEPPDKPDIIPLTPISQIRREHLRRTIKTTGMVQDKSELYQETTGVTYICTDHTTCGKPHTITPGELIRPTRRCPYCQSNARRDPDKDEITDNRMLKIEELHASRETGDPERIYVKLRNKLTSDEITKNIVRGTNIAAIGPLKTFTNGKVNSYYIDALGILSLGEEYQRIIVTEDDKKELLQIQATHGSLLKYWAGHLYTAIEGLTEIKVAIILSLIYIDTLGGANQKLRSRIHILLLGDRSQAKSQLLKLTNTYALKSRYVIGAGSSGVGLTASVETDEITGKRTVVPGEAPLCNNGHLLLDEADKIPEDQVGILHSALEDGIIKISKSAKAEYPTNIAAIWAANPLKGFFEPTQDPLTQTSFPPTLISRMDLPYILRGDYNEVHVKAMAQKMLNNLRGEKQEENIELFKKYQKLCRDSPPIIKPPIFDHKIITWYNDIARRDHENARTSISPRAINAIMRISAAMTRAELRAEITEQDIDNAILLYQNCMRDIGYDPLTGSFNVERLETGRATTSITVRTTIINYVSEMHKQHLPCTDDEILNHLKERHSLLREDKLQQEIERANKEGDISIDPLMSGRIGKDCYYTPQRRMNP